MRTREELIKLADQLFDCLPCRSLDLPRLMGLSRSDVAALLRFVRERHLDQDSRPIVPFTVAPGKRGAQGSWYFAVLLEKDRSYYLDRDNYDHLEEGLIGTLKEAAAKLRHAADAARAFAAGIRNSAAKWYWEDRARGCARAAEDNEHDLKRIFQSREERSA